MKKIIINIQVLDKAENWELNQFKPRLIILDDTIIKLSGFAMFEGFNYLLLTDVDFDKKSNKQVVTFVGSISLCELVFDCIKTNQDLTKHFEILENYTHFILDKRVSLDGLFEQLSRWF